MKSSAKLAPFCRQMPDLPRTDTKKKGATATDSQTDRQTDTERDNSLT